MSDDKGIEDIAKVMADLGVKVTPFTPKESFNIPDLISKGWRYVDTPRMLRVFWEYTKRSLGEEGKDYHLLTEATYGGMMRGQLLISPQGFTNMDEYRKTNPLPEVDDGRGETTETN